MFVAVHVGCGFHPKNTEQSLNKLCVKACRAGMKVLKESAHRRLCAAAAAQASMVVLEDSQLTNCGVGSNLTEAGQVECDASIMISGGLAASAGRTKHKLPAHPLFGAVGAVQGLKNPILLAGKLAELGETEEGADGRIHPCLLVAEGAVQFAKQHGVAAVEPRDLITDASRRRFETQRKRIVPCATDEPGAAGNVPATRADEAETDSHKKRKVSSPQTDTPAPLGQGERMDTVGVVCCDTDGVVASAVSSGGIILKRPGRVGQGALYGSGCFAHANAEHAVAVCTSGVGEELMKTALASECGKMMLSESCAIDAVEHAIKGKFLESPYLGPNARREGGLLALRICNMPATASAGKSSQTQQRRVELFLAHSTSSMGVGYMSSKDEKPVVIMSRLSPDSVGPTVCIEGIRAELDVPL